MNILRGLGSRAIAGTLRRALLALFLTGLLSVASTSSAQEAGELTIHQLTVAEKEGGLTAFVSVLDSTGRPVLGLSDFDFAVDDEPAELQSVESVINEKEGIAVLLLIDASPSMRGEPFVQAQLAATSLVKTLLPQDVAAVAVFSSGSTLDAAQFLGDHAQLVDEIGRLQIEAQSGTALYDAVVGSLATIGEAPSARRAILLLTDGRDSGEISTSTREDALRASEASGKPIYTIGVGPDADVEFLQTLAERSGGAFYMAPTATDVLEIFRAIGTRLRSEYVLTLRLPPGQSTERELLVSLDLDGRILTARKGFIDPNATASGSAGGDGPPVWFWLLPASSALVVVGFLGWHFKRRRQSSPVPGGPGRAPSEPFRSFGALQPDSVRPGRLTVIDGPDVGVSVAFTLGPVEIGSDPSCDLALAPVDGAIAWHHARAWLRSNRLMLHHLARGRQTLVGDRPMEWMVLRHREALRIGPDLIEFALEEG